MEELVALAENEARYIRRVLDHTGWAIAGKGGAAEILDLPASTLRSRMKNSESSATPEHEVGLRCQRHRGSGRPPAGPERSSRARWGARRYSRSFEENGCSYLTKKDQNDLLSAGAADQP